MRTMNHADPLTEDEEMLKHDIENRRRFYASAESGFDGDSDDLPLVASNHGRDPDDMVAHAIAFFVALVLLGVLVAAAWAICQP